MSVPLDSIRVLSLLFLSCHAVFCCLRDLHSSVVWSLAAASQVGLNSERGTPEQDRAGRSGRGRGMIDSREAAGLYTHCFTLPVACVCLPVPVCGVCLSLSVCLCCCCCRPLAARAQVKRRPHAHRQQQRAEERTAANTHRKQTNQQQGQTTGKGRRGRRVEEGAQRTTTRVLKDCCPTLFPSAASLLCPALR